MRRVLINEPKGSSAGVRNLLEYGPSASRCNVAKVPFADIEVLPKRENFYCRDGIGTVGAELFRTPKSTGFVLKSRAP